MYRFHLLLLGSLSMLSMGLFGSTEPAEDSQDPTAVQKCYKLEIVKGVSNALSTNVEVSKKATRSSKKDSKKSSSCGCCAILISADDINPHGYVIDKPGLYKLKEDTRFHPKNPGLTAIVIDADNVTLDLCEKTLSQKNSKAGTIGVLVNGRENVVVENGTVSGFTYFGVRVNAETSYLTLKDLNVLENGVNEPAALAVSGGISITSGLPAAITHDILIHKVNASGNFLAGLILSGVTNVDVTESRFNNNISATTGYGTNSWGLLATAFYVDPTNPSFLPCTNLNIFDCEANSNRGTSGTVGMEILSVPAFGFALNNNVTIERCVANQNIGGGDAGIVNEGEGIVLAGTQNFVVRDCVASGNATSATQPSGTPGFFASTGFGIPFGCVNGLFENCVAEGNSGAGDSSHGFRILRSSNITVSNCTAIGNNNTSTGEAWGFTTDPSLGNDAGEFGPPVNTNFIFQNCVAEANTSQNGICGGFKFVSQVNSVLAFCKSVGNGHAAAPNGYGIFVTDPACCGPNNCCAVDPVVCKTGTTCLPFSACCPTLHNVINNNEVVGNTLWGIFDGSNSNAKNAYYANVARGNGTNYSLPPGTPIRIWPLPALPNTTDNNGVLDSQLDNISITP